MNLKGLLHRELGEGMTEVELASIVGVPVRTVVAILNGWDPQSPAMWYKFAKYFRMSVDFLRTGESAHASTRVELPGIATHSAAGDLRKIPLLSWHRMGEVTTRKHLPGVINAEAMVETTDVSGTRTFALKVQDDSMEPMFSEGEIIFVNPDLKWKAGDYVVTNGQEWRADSPLLRQVKPLGDQLILHPLNRKYEDISLTKQNDVAGKVVRLRKNL
jgi:SOS-response transcriptional repressor LexA